MKKTALLTGWIILSGGFLAAQGLYNIMPFDDEPLETLPLKWTVAGSVGYDTNPIPRFSEVPGVDTDSSGYISGFVQANYARKTPQTTWDFWGRAGVTYYFKEPEQTFNLPGGELRQRVDDQVFSSLRGGVNLIHRFTERVRFRSMNYVTYENEPDFDYGLGTDRRQGPYTAYSTDNSVGYRWTPRFGTNTGFRINGVHYHWDDFDRSDYIRYLIYNQFRYRVAPTTVWTSSIRYGAVNNDGFRDASSWFFLVGAEHQVSPTTVAVARVGAQYFQPDNGSDSWSPYVEGMIRSQLSERFSVRGFLRYGLEGNNPGVTTDVMLTPFGVLTTRAVYDERHTFRTGLQGSFVVSPKLTLFGGGAYVHLKYDDLLSAAGPEAAPGDLSEWLLNLNVGGSYEINRNLYVTASYNFDHGGSDSIVNEFDRHRVQVGMQATF